VPQYENGDSVRLKKKKTGIARTRKKWLLETLYQDIISNTWGLLASIKTLISNTWGLLVLWI